MTHVLKGTDGAIELTNKPKDTLFVLFGAQYADVVRIDMVLSVLKNTYIHAKVHSAAALSPA